MNSETPSTPMKSNHNDINNQVELIDTNPPKNQTEVVVDGDSDDNGKSAADINYVTQGKASDSSVPNNTQKYSDEGSLENFPILVLLNSGDDENTKKSEYTKYRSANGILPFTSTCSTASSADDHSSKEDDQSANNIWNEVQNQDSIMQCVRKGLVSNVVKASKLAAMNPISTIMVTIIFSMLMLFVGVTTNMSINVDIHALFTPFGVRTSDHGQWSRKFDPNDRIHYAPQYNATLMDEVNQQQKEEKQQNFDIYDRTRKLQATSNSFDRVPPLTQNDNFPFDDENATSFIGGSNAELLQQQQLMMMSSSSQHRKLQVMDGLNPVHLMVHLEGDNILSERHAVEAIRRVFDAIDTIKSVPEYDHICSHTDYIDEITGENTCQIHSITRFWNNNRTYFEEEVNNNGEHFYQDVLLPTISSNRYPDGSGIDANVLIGRLQQDAETNTVTFGESFSAYIVMRDYNFQPGVGIQTNNILLQNALQLRRRWMEEDTFRLECYDMNSLEQEVFRAVLADLPLIPVVFAVMIIFTCIIFFRHDDKIQSRTMVGVGSVITITLSIATGFGIAFMSGVDFTPMTTILPFLIFGIGLDDTFIITGAYFETDPQKDTVDRVVETMETVGLSIITTTLTTSLAFILGLISTVPAIYWLMLYAFPTIIVDFVYQITFFIAILVLDERRIKRQQNDYCYCCCFGCIGCKKYNNTHSDVEQQLQQLQIEGKKQDQPKQQHQQQVTEDASRRKQRDIPGEVTLIINDGSAADATEANSTGTLETPLNTSLAVGDRFMTWYSNQLLKPWVKVIVLIAFFAYFAVAIYFTSLMRQEFKATDMVPKDSFVSDYLTSLQAYTRRGVTGEFVFRFVDPSTEEMQEQMRNYITEISELPVFEEPPVFCWVTGLDQMMQAEEYRQMKEFLDNSNMSFNQKIDFILKSDPIIDDLFGHTMERDDEGNIAVTKCWIYFSNLDLDDVQQQMDIFRDINRITAEQPINQYGANPYTPKKEDYSFYLHSDTFYTWEFYTAAVSELISTTLSSVAAVCVVVFFVVPHWSALLFVFPTIVMLYIDLIGTLQVIGVRINSITYIAMVISIGLMVDFIVHVLMRYYESTCKNREDKVKDCLRTMGKSILIGGLSTFLGAAPLLFSTSALLWTIFVTFFAMITLSLFHGLMFLPVILSLVGPIS